MRATITRAMKSLTGSKLGTLRVVGPDTRGIVAAFAQVLDRHGCCIVKSEQWTDRKDNHFFHYALDQ